MAATVTWAYQGGRRRISTKKINITNNKRCERKSVYEHRNWLWIHMSPWKGVLDIAYLYDQQIKRVPPKNDVSTRQQQTEAYLDRGRKYQTFRKVVGRRVASTWINLLPLACYKRWQWYASWHKYWWQEMSYQSSMLIYCHHLSIIGGYLGEDVHPQIACILSP